MVSLERATAPDPLELLPAAFRRLCDLARAGNAGDAQALDVRLQDAVDFMGVEPNPIPVKAILARLGIGHGLRLPLTTLSDPHAARADAVAAAIPTIEHTCRARAA